MTRQINRLTPKQVQSAHKPGQYADGQGLYLLTTNGGRRWVFIYRWQGKRREMGLGSARTVPLSRARALANDARAHLAEGRDPIRVRECQRAVKEEGAVPTFGEFTESYIASVEEGWRNAKHRQQWRNSLRDHAAGLLNVPISDVSTEHVLEVLRPIWLKVPETASRVRGRIERILSAAKARGLRPPDAGNPGQWRGHLDVLLPKRQRLTRGHHAAMPYSEVPHFFSQLAERPGSASSALQLLILTAARSGEVLGATWGEVEGGLWTLPPHRMKAGAQHQVTLSRAAEVVLGTLGRGAPNEPIFCGRGHSGHLSNMAMEMLMRRMNVGQFTVHGFRSAFKDWALNETEFADEISEEALAHVVGSKARRAYRRGAALERRRALMEAWAEHVTRSADVLELAA